MAEDLDHLLPVNHLFNISVDIGDILLLFHEESAASACDLLDQHQHQHSEGQHHQSHPDAQVHHGDKHGDHGYHRREQLRQTLGQHLAERIRIVGIVTHHITMGAGVKIFHRQCLHVGKHFVTNDFQGALGNHRHGSREEESSQDACQEDACDLHDRMQQPVEDRCCLQQHRKDIVIDQTLQEQ